jgi:hypothetical protein
MVLTVRTRAVFALLALAISGCGGSSGHSNQTLPRTPAAPSSVTTAANAAGQTVNLSDAAGRTVAVTLPAASGAVPAGTTVTVSVSDTSPAGFPASKGRRTLSGTTSGIFLQISASTDYTLSAQPGFVIDGTTATTFSAGTYQVSIGVDGSSTPATVLGNATLQGNTLTFVGAQTPFSFDADTVYDLSVQLESQAAITVSPATLTVASGGAVVQFLASDTVSGATLTAMSNNTNVTVSAPTPASGGGYTFNVSAMPGLTSAQNATITVSDNSTPQNTAQVAVSVTPASSSPTAIITLGSTATTALPVLTGTSSGVTGTFAGSVSGVGASSTPGILLTATTSLTLPSGIPNPSGTLSGGVPLYIVQVTPSAAPADLPAGTTLALTIPGSSTTLPPWSAYTGGLGLGVYVGGTWIPLSFIYPILTCPCTSPPPTFTYTLTSDLLDPSPQTVTFAVLGLP